MPNNETPQENPFKKILVRIAYIIGVIAAIALLAFAATRLLPSIFSYIGTTTSKALTSLFGGSSAPSLEVTSSKKNPASGEAFILSWSAGTSTLQSSISYACASNLSLAYMGSESTRVPVPCGKDFKIGGSTHSVTLVPTLSTTGSFADAVLTVTADTGTRTLKGSTVVTIGSKVAGSGDTLDNFGASYIPSTATSSNTKASSTPVLTNKTPSHPTATHVAVYSGPADLAISTIGVSANSDSSVLGFTATNMGGSYTGPWHLRATGGNISFESGVLASLAPGQSERFSLSLGNGAYQGSYSIVIMLDSRAEVREANEGNNTAATTIQGNGTSYGETDLVPRILGETGSGNEAIVTFEIANLGTKTARDWQFEANLPVDKGDTVYTSPRQPDLLPGATLHYTLRFDDTVNGYFEVTVDNHTAKVLLN